MNEPLPSQKQAAAAPSQAQLDAEAESFMSFMATHQANVGKG